MPGRVSSYYHPISPSSGVKAGRWLAPSRKRIGARAQATISAANGDDIMRASYRLALGHNGILVVTGSSGGDYATVVYQEVLTPVALSPLVSQNHAITQKAKRTKAETLVGAGVLLWPGRSLRRIKP